MPRARPPHLHRERNRHGDFVWYVRREHGKRTRLRAEFGSEAFWSEYRAALEGAVVPLKVIKPQTVAWAIHRYRSSSPWKAFAPATRRQRDNIFLSVLKTAGATLLVDIDQHAIRQGRERRADHPHAANNFLKTMRGLFGWALEAGYVAGDPTKGVKLLKGKNDKIGFHTWTEEEVERFEIKWSIGTRERLALDLLLFTGLRRGDVVRLGRQHVRNGVMSFPTEKKGAEREVVIPMLDVLAATIAASKTGDLTFITTARGTPFVKESFGNWFKEACIAAGVPGSAHGLRKAGAVRAAENGATEWQLQAIYNWSTSKMAQLYPRAANKKRLAAGAIEMLMPAQKQNEKIPHPSPGAGANAKTASKRRA
ncbi:MAG: Integrase/recombinase [Tardiphaga sp.]|nr:Integrase/recombinase [Tardiphaga sp.]